MMGPFPHARGLYGYLIKANVFTRKEIAIQVAIQSVQRLTLVGMGAVGLWMIGPFKSIRWFGLFLDLFAGVLVVWAPVRRDIENYAETLAVAPDTDEIPHRREMKQLLRYLADLVLGLLLFAIGFVVYSYGAISF